MHSKRNENRTYLRYFITEESNIPSSAELLLTFGLQTVQVNTDQVIFRVVMTTNYL